MRARVQATWAGGDYGPLAARLEPAAVALVDALGVRPGDRFLDVAAGTGNVALEAARRGAAVTAVDVTPRMLDLGRARAEGAGLEVTWVEADAEDLGVGDAAFDVVASAFGVIFAPHPAVAVAELRRVLRPGGRAGLTAWTADGHMARMTGAIRPFLPDPGAAGHNPLDWGDAAAATALLAPQFALAEVRAATLPWRFASAAAARAFLERHSPSHLAAAAALPPGRGAELFDAIEAFHDGLAGQGSAVEVAAEYLLITADAPTG